MRSRRYYPTLLPTSNPITFERAKEEVLTVFDELMEVEREPQNAALVAHYSSEAGAASGFSSTCDVIWTPRSAVAGFSVGICSRSRLAPRTSIDTASIC